MKTQEYLIHCKIILRGGSQEYYITTIEGNIDNYYRLHNFTKASNFVLEVLISYFKLKKEYIFILQEVIRNYNKEHWGDIEYKYLLIKSIKLINNK